MLGGEEGAHHRTVSHDIEREDNGDVNGNGSA